MIQKIYSINRGSAMFPIGFRSSPQTVRQVLQQSGSTCQLCIIYKYKKLEPIFSGTVPYALSLTAEFLNYSVLQKKITGNEIYILCHKSIY